MTRFVDVVGRVSVGVDDPDGGAVGGAASVARSPARAPNSDGATVMASAATVARHTPANAPTRIHEVRRRRPPEVTSSSGSDDASTLPNSI
jgi:hypothetical protein